MSEDAARQMTLRSKKCDNVALSKPKKQRIFVQDKDKWEISKGKDFKKDAIFSQTVSNQVKSKIDSYFNDLPRGRKMTVLVNYEVEEE